MGLLRWAATGVAGYGVYKVLRRQRAAVTPVAFAEGEAPGDNFAKVRSAGIEGMRSAPPGWDAYDEAMDESFPASDPSAHY